MTKVKRFIYVRAPRRKTVHIAYSHIEGPTACGRFTAPGWAFWVRRRKGDRVCKLCEQRA